MMWAYLVTFPSYKSVTLNQSWRYYIMTNGIERGRGRGRVNERQYAYVPVAKQSKWAESPVTTLWEVGVVTNSVGNDRGCVAPPAVDQSKSTVITSSLHRICHSQIRRWPVVYLRESLITSLDA